MQSTNLHVRKSDDHNLIKSIDSTLETFKLRKHLIIVKGKLFFFLQLQLTQIQIHSYFRVKTTTRNDVTFGNKTDRQLLISEAIFFTPLNVII